jgi:hypothetical protein
MGYYEKILPIEKVANCIPRNQPCFEMQVFSIEELLPQRCAGD